MPLTKGSNLKIDDPRTQQEKAKKHHKNKNSVILDQYCEAGILLMWGPSLKGYKYTDMN